MKHLTLEQRYQIWSLREVKTSMSQIARILDKDKSTISRELKRNKSPGMKYKPEDAHKTATKRKTEAHKHLKLDETMKEFIEEKIRDDWSPEQITGFCKKHKINMISHERIYQYIALDKEKNGELYKHLRRATKRKKKYGTEEFRGQIKDRISIDERPSIVNQKIRFGDWEGDTVIGKDHKGVLLTLVERTTKLTLIKNVPDKKAKTISDTIIEILTPFKDISHTITYDNGKEFALHKETSKALGINAYFSHPYSSWERGLNENTNGLIRQYLPKKIDFRNVSDIEIQKIIRKLNTRPRKTLGFASPIEALLQMRL